jgi:membrane protein
MQKTSFKKTMKDIFKIASGTFNAFLNDKGLKLSASLSYYTVFSLGPLLLLLISLAGIFLGKDAIQGKLFSEMNGLIGSNAALQVQDMIKNIELSGKSTISLVIAIVTLIIGATSVFGEIQDSINMIWKVKAKPKRGWVKLIKDRLLSSSLIISIGFLLVVSLVLNGFILALSGYLARLFPGTAIILLNILNMGLSFLFISVLFGVIFKVLPDVKIGWKDVRAGAFFTAILFLIGRFLIGFYIETTATGSAFGAAGSIIVILVWVYYTAAILYMGAEFTQTYAEFKGSHIQPADYAVHVEQRETLQDVEVLPPQHNFEDK